MIRIAVCDDDANTTHSIYEYLKSKDEQLESETLDISLYYSGKDFLNDIDLGVIFHIVLMDIQMDGINGIEVGGVLRNRPNGDDIIMVYISGHDGYFEDLAKIGSFRFVRKPVEIADLDDIFTRALNQAIKYKTAMYKPSVFKFKSGTEFSTVKIDSIAYMKHIARIVELYLWDNDKKNTSCTNKFYAKLDEVIKCLPRDQFVHCGRSYVVNIAYVGMMEKAAFILIDKKSTKIPISKTCRKEAKQAYFKYMESLT